FVPFAEETGLITRIDLWVLGRALTQLQRWHSQGFAHLSVSVNLSVRSLQNPHLPHLVANLLTAMNLPPDSLQLEVTESAAMLDIERTIALLKELRAIGVQLAIDDFGTGYSSLGYLRRLPVQILKIDRSFVRDITESNDAAAIASAVIAIGHILDMRIVAEGVETQAQRTFLMHHGCDAIQGYLISPPQPSELAEKLLGQALFELKR
ncbi:MAG: EAL domain-containing protein, partial [Chloroflexia bacterium]|nr:EAL domain-containing protein [Chloroflexia bacterium]